MKKLLLSFLCVVSLLISLGSLEAMSSKAPWGACMWDANNIQTEDTLLDSAVTLGLSWVRMLSGPSNIHFVDTSFFDDTPESLSTFFRSEDDYVRALRKHNLNILSSWVPPSALNNLSNIPDTNSPTGYLQLQPHTATWNTALDTCRARWKAWRKWSQVN